MVNLAIGRNVFQKKNLFEGFDTIFFGKVKNHSQHCKIRVSQYQIIVICSLQVIPRNLLSDHTPYHAETEPWFNYLLGLMQKFILVIPIQ